MNDDHEHPKPTYDIGLVTVALHDDDDPDDFDVDLDEADVDDEAVAARTEFSWTVRFTVCGTWVVDGFNLDHDRAFDMIKHGLGYAHDYEVNAQVVEAPPPSLICAIQGGREDNAQVGRKVLQHMLSTAVFQARQASAK